MSSTGVVKWFNDAKGFGFIVADDADGDIFAHRSQIIDKITEGDRVEFVIEDNPKGKRALEIKKL